MIRGTKFGNRKVEIDGHVFDSRKEARRYAELRVMEKAGEISNLQTQVPFLLIPNQLDENGHVIERAVTYRADFMYNRGGRLIVEDTKGYRDGGAYSLFVIKRKLMLKIHGIRVVET